MITKVSYRPYAQGINNTQNQKQKVNFGMNTSDSNAVTEFTEKIKAAIDSARNPQAHALTADRRMTEALHALGKVSSRTTMAELLPVLTSIWRF